MLSNVQPTNLIEIDDSDSEIEVITHISQSSSSSNIFESSRPKRKRDDNAYDDARLRKHTREFSISIDERRSNIPQKHRKTAKAFYSFSPSTLPLQHQDNHPLRRSRYKSQPSAKKGTSTLIWIKGEPQPSARSSFKVNAVKEPCTKIFRTGFEYNGVEFKVNDAILISTGTPFHGLIRSIFTVKFEDATIHDRHFVHVHRLKTSVSANSPGCRRGKLFLEHGQCQDVSIKQVIKGSKLDFERIGGTSGAARGNAKHFCQFVDQPTHSTIREPSLAEAQHGCDSCESRHERDKYNKPCLSNGVLQFGDKTFHSRDFVFIDPKIRGTAYIIGQIQEWTQNAHGTLVTVRILKRHQEVVQNDSAGFVSSRRLVATDQTDMYPGKLLMGKAFVMPSEDDGQDLDKSNSFWCSERVINDGSRNRIVPLKKPLPNCGTCLDVERKVQQEFSDYLDVSRFPAADYYSGAGGFLLPGLSMFKWISAIDYDEAACQTLHELRKRSRSLNVHHAKVSDKIEYTTARHTEDKLNSRCLPEPGSVFIMTGGPPCQGHSRVNHANNPSPVKQRDPRNDELHVMLAEASRLRPYVILIENVSAFKDDKFNEGGENGEENYGRKAMQELAELGYSCRLGIIDSRSYGTPQNRLRCFILAVRAGLPLPDFPAPSHSNPKVTATIFKGAANVGQVMPFYIGARNTPGTGPHPAVTIHDAISDLPAFSYLLPSSISRPIRRRAIPVFNGARHAQLGNSTKVGFTSPSPYACDPRNEYQREKREGVQALKDHYTSYVTDGAAAILFSKSDQPNPRGCERRATFSEGFSTLLTNSSPGQKGTAVIHPSQDRKFTIAERKRAMGWPDWHKLAGTPIDQDRLTGNGVCFESVQAMYTEIIKTTIVPWWVQAGRPVENVYEKFKNDYP
ncbi:uncharacterized protein IL334_002702 [Kwoniella shivajii]|uniref:DNA (cytosine-5-)-methyltransferase n=1 Tax=Kwoniella shivajii TaxID=564305 RepID=A0ABZ1CVH0_9TREE|nr:hypothetical protein IL334_002702 [Kwoniella shivajii]